MNTKNEYKQIRFNASTGEVFLKDEPIGELRPGTRMFFFFKTLYESYPSTISYEELAKKTRKICGKGKDEYSYEDYCHDTKKKIKQSYLKIGNLIENFSTKHGENGYRLKKIKARGGRLILPLLGYIDKKGIGHLVKSDKNK